MNPFLLHSPGRWLSEVKHHPLLICPCCGRWLNQLKPELKRGPFTVEEEAELIRLHHKYGNKWALIAKCLPGR